MGGKVAPPQLDEGALRDLVDAAFDALVIAHMGNVVFANRSFVEMYGGTAEDVLGRSMLDFVAPESRETVIAKMTAGIESRYEAVGLRRDGTRIDVEICARAATYEGKPVRVSAIRYITDRKLAEQALRRSEARLRLLIERITDIILVQRDGRVVFANPAALRYLDYATVSDIIGKDVLDLVHPGDQERVRSHLAHPPPSALVNARIVRRDGSGGIAEIATAAIDEFDGGPAVVVLARDIAERQTMESRLVQADLLSSIGMLTAGIAHEINNPLAYVTLNLEVMVRKLAALRHRLGPAPAAAANEQLCDLEQLLTMTREGADRVRHIVHDFRVFARGSGGGRSVVDLTNVLDATIKLAFSLRDAARVVRDYEPVPLVEADEPRLGQLFLNLVTNALQAFDDESASGNEVHVRTRTSPEGAAVIEITDNGRGIPYEVLGRVFEPFFSTKAVGVGTGLGLPICQSIVAALGGALTLESTIGRGTTCRVILPALAHGETKDAPPVVTKAPTRNCRRVLVVDDERALLRTLGEELGRQHDVTCTASGSDAIDLILNGAFDAVVCDVMMPSTSGIEIFNAVRAKRPGLEKRFVFMTAGACTQPAREFLASVPNRKIEKPFTCGELEDAIDEVEGA
jgi:PAS domain S-box-containing protein